MIGTYEVLELGTCEVLESGICEVLETGTCKVLESGSCEVCGSGEVLIQKPEQVVIFMKKRLGDQEGAKSKTSPQKVLV
jgi:hypothetical protein